MSDTWSPVRFRSDPDYSEGAGDDDDYTDRCDELSDVYHELCGGLRKAGLDFNKTFVEFLEWLKLK